MRDAIVVGAGPAGCAMALFLRQRHRDVLLLDAACFPRDKVCGESVSPGAWPLLEALDAKSAVQALHPHPLTGMTLAAQDGTRFVGEYGAGRVAGFALRREALDFALLARARAAGVEVREGSRATGLIWEGGRVVGLAWENGRGPEAARARVVVGADGRASRVARALGLLRESRRWRKFAVRGHWEGVEGLSHQGEMHVGGGGYCGVAPLSATSANVAFVLDRRALAPAGGDLVSFYRETLLRWPRLAERLTHARLLGPPRAIGPLAVEARRVSAPGALLIGDAAGFFDPFTGEGVTLALRSAEMAAEVVDLLLQGRASDLTEYDRRREEATREKFRFNRLVQKIVGWPALGNLLARRLRRRGDLADRLVGIAGDLVPARGALGAGFLWDLLLP